MNEQGMFYVADITVKCESEGIEARAHGFALPSAVSFLSFITVQSTVL